MLTFEHFCESRKKYLEWNPTKGFYGLHDTVRPICARNYKFLVMDKKNRMVEVSADKIVHPPEMDTAMGKVPVKSFTGISKRS